MSTTYNGVIYEELSVDVSQSNEFAPRLVKQADAYTRGYIITLTKDGEKLTIPTANTTAWFNARNQTDPTKRASATGTINNNGTVTFIVPTVVMEVAGYIQCDVSIITASDNDTHILKSTLFYLTCEAAANPDGTTSQAEDSILAGIAAGTIAVPGSYVPKTRKIAGIDLQDDITEQELKTALDVDISGKMDKVIVENDPTQLSSIPEGQIYKTQGAYYAREANNNKTRFALYGDLPDISGKMNVMSSIPVNQSGEPDGTSSEYQALQDRQLFYTMDQGNVRYYIKASGSGLELAQESSVKTRLNAKEATDNRVNSISSSSDNNHYPTAKAVYDYVDTVIGGIENGSY